MIIECVSVDLCTGEGKFCEGYQAIWVSEFIESGKRRKILSGKGPEAKKVKGDEKPAQNEKNKT